MKFERVFAPEWMLCALNIAEEHLQDPDFTLDAIELQEGGKVKLTALRAGKMTRFVPASSMSTIVSELASIYQIGIRGRRRKQDLRQLGYP